MTAPDDEDAEMKTLCAICRSQRRWGNDVVV